MLGFVGMIDHSVCRVERRCDADMKLEMFVFGRAITSIENVDLKAFQFGKTIRISAMP